MADIVNDGMTAVSYVPTISSTSAPTVAELNAGTRLDSYLTPDGLGLEFGNESVDVTALSSTYNAELPGRQTVSTELTLKHQGDASAPFSTFASKPEGYIVLRRNVVATTAWTASQTVEVYAVQFGTRRRVAPAANEVLKFTVQAFHTAAPVFGATVAA
jgi:hypothetical protein